jgi:hypothetical protein
MTLQVQPAGGPSPAGGVDGSVPAAMVSGVSPSLLPEPGEGGLNGTQDALSMMFGLVAQQGQLTAAIGENSVKASTRAQDTQLDLERHAELAEQKAEASQGGFWNDLLDVAEDVAKVVGVVVAVAAAAVATVCTAGTAGIAIVAVAAVLISSGAVVSATHCLGKDSAYFGLGMEVAGSVLTLGATSGAVASNALTDAAQGAISAGQAVAGTATVVAGVSSIEVGKFQSESENDEADVQQCLNAINQQNRMVSELVSGLKNTEKSNQNALQIIAGAAQTYGQTLTTAASGGRA